MYFDAKVDTRSFWEHYMPVFHDCIVTAKGMHAMCSYNSMNGVPTCGDPNLLNGILRNQWGWDGFVVSDYDAYANIFGTHHFTKTMEEAAAGALYFCAPFKSLFYLRLPLTARHCSWNQRWIGSRGGRDRCDLSPPRRSEARADERYSDPVGVPEADAYADPSGDVRPPKFDEVQHAGKI